MKQWKAFLVEVLARRNIYVSRKYHPNDGTITLRIQEELAKQAGGILHIGAHEGQEADLYSRFGVPVLWIEAIPSKHEQLLTKLKNFPDQKSICALLGASNENAVKFNVSSNNGASSSLYFPKEKYALLFSMVETLLLDMKRLDTLMSETEIQKYRQWVVDVQGAELAVLQGAGSLIHYCNSLIVEAKRDSYYENGTNWNELTSFLHSKGFIPLWQIGTHDEDNAYFVRVESRVN